MLSGLTVDGNAVTISDTYTFTNITGNHTITATFESANSAPSTPTVTVSSKTTSSFTVTTSATDADGDNLTYKLYVGDSLKATSAATASGTQVTLSATGLSEYTNYSYYVTATDGTETSTSSTVSVRTYCPGTGTCTSYYYCNSFPDCSSCNGSGVSCTNFTSNGNIAGWEGTTTDVVCPSCNTSAEKDYGTGTCKDCNSTIQTTYHCRKSGCGYQWSEITSTSSSSCKCPSCNGTGNSACNHGEISSHYACSLHGSLSSSGSHNGCSHGYTVQHD